MTNNEMKEMLERQLVRLEEMSTKTTSSKALSGLSSSMLAVAVRLERLRICGEEMVQAEKSLIQAREAASKRLETIGSRRGKDDPSYRSAMDLNTEATAKRKLVMTLEFKPDNDRQNVVVSVTAKSTLAPTTPVVTTLYIADGETVVEMAPADSRADVRRRRGAGSARNAESC